ncbi:MAG TPA: 2OG-Fe(II) oxygenase [Pyrinomonadaceae bacterium]|nr:2OG-Fe(II) oxygenase [Pyrinomonadaceae bacterium]
MSIENLPLPELLANRPWLKRLHPFPHYVAREVFIERAYREIEGTFREFLSGGLSEQPGTGQFARHKSGYDAYSLGFTPQLCGPLRIFLSRAWADLLARLAGVSHTGEVNGGLHYHLVGSRSGRVHNDLNPGWFVDCEESDGINVSQPDLCSYFHGQTFREGLVARERVRAVAMLFYLNNQPWREGDGGETGLYSFGGTSVENYAAAVPPLNNSLLVFECTPYSYHTFLSNRRHPRSCVIMWLHRTKEEAVSRWGEAKIVNWPRAGEKG